MNARLTKELDRGVTNTWLIGHEMSPLPNALFPQTGAIVDDVCVGWLYETDSALGLLELFVSNPYAKKTVINQGIDIVVQRLLRLAKDKGMIGLMVTTKLPSIYKRAVKFGFSKQPGEWVVLVRRI